MTVRTASALALAGLVLAFVAIGCGGDDSASGDETTTEATTTTEGTTTEGSSESGTLKGETGPGFEIEVSRDGEDAETVSAGTYTLEVEDKSDMHTSTCWVPVSTRKSPTWGSWVRRRSRSRWSRAPTRTSAIPTPLKA